MKKIYNMGVLCFACLLGTTQIGLATSPQSSDSETDHDHVVGMCAPQNSGNSLTPQASSGSSKAPFGEIPPNQEILLDRELSSLSTGPSQASVATQPDSPPPAQAQLKITPTKRQRDGSSETMKVFAPLRKKRRTKEENAENTATSAEVQEIPAQLRKQFSDFLLQSGGGIPFIETGVLVEAVMNSGIRPRSHQRPITDDEAMRYIREEGMHFNALKSITSQMWCELLSKTTLVISGSATVHQPVFNLSFLNTLCLVNCSVVKELPTAPHLKTLVLHGCTVIPPIQDQPGLKTLDIASDTTNGQIPTLNNLPSLESLSLKGPVTEKGGPFIYSGSLKLLNLTELVLDLEIGRPRFNVMGPLPNLQTLHIKSADLTDYQISDGLKHYRVLKTLVLENYYGNLEITHQYISKLTVVCSDVLLKLGQLLNLESLYLSGVDTQNGFEPLMAPEKIGPYPYLKDIVLRHCVTTAIVHKTPYLRCLRVEGVNSIKKLQSLPSLESLSLDFHVLFSKLTLNNLPALSELCIHFLKRQNEAVDGCQLASFEQITEPGKLLSSALFIQVALPLLTKMNLTFGAHGEVDFDTLSEKDQAKVELSPVQKSKLPKLKTFRVYNLLSRT